MSDSEYFDKVLALLRLNLQNVKKVPLPIRPRLRTELTIMYKKTQSFCNSAHSSEVTHD